MKAIKLNASSGRIEFVPESGDRWCTCHLCLAGKEPVRLGSEAFNVLRERFLAMLAVSGNQLDERPSWLFRGQTVYWLASLCEPHCAIYCSLPEDGGARLFFQNQDGVITNDMSITDVERRTWIASLMAGR